MDDNITLLWLVISTILVASMQIGFLFVEAGFVRSKNSINVAMKNLIDFTFALLIFMAVGSAIMFGKSDHGLLGWSNILVGWRQVTTDQMMQLFFQAMFCGTAATILSGAIAERIKFSAYLIIIIPLTAIIYPIVGHWAWGSLLFAQSSAGWLQNIGFVDAAGASVVHVTGGMAALALVIILGARRGRFNEKTGKAHMIQGYSPILAAAGSLTLFMGWLGFNSGGLTPGSDNFAYAIVNTSLAGAAGAIAALILGRKYDGFYRSDRSINGLIAGLVAITAAAPYAYPLSAMLIGALGATIMFICSEWLEKKWKLDDAVSAISVHGAAGILGTIAVPLIARDGIFDMPIIQHLAVQAIGTFSIAAFVFISIFALGKLIKLISDLRISDEEETRGLNQSEHGTSIGAAGLERTLRQLNMGHANLNSRVSVNDFEEGADIAQSFNQFLTKMQQAELQARARIEKEQSERAAQENMIFQRIAQKEKSKSQKLAATLSHFQNEFGILVDNLQNHALSLSQEAKTLNAHMMTSNNEVVEAGSASQQSAQIAMQVTNAINQLSQSLNAMASDIEHASQSAGQAAKASNEGRRAVIALEQGAQSIAKLIGAIEAIAKQTNMVALNARIEASHAGDEGHAFAVVAKEISELAKQTREASSSIAFIVGDVGNLIGEAVARFRIIDKEVEAVSSISAQAHHTSYQQVKDALQISDLVRDSSKLSQITGSAVSQASANISATSKASAGLDETADQLKILAQSLEHTYAALSHSVERGHSERDDLAA